MVDLGSKGTQEQLAALVGVSQQAVSLVAGRGVLQPGATLGEWLLAYCEHLRGIAAGRGGDDGVELSRERAALARAQTERIEMMNAERRRELAPARLLEDLLARTASRAARVLETIPGEIRRRLPSATSDDIQAVTTIVSKARNVIASLRRVDIFGDLAAVDAESSDAADADADTESA